MGHRVTKATGSHSGDKATGPHSGGGVKRRLAVVSSCMSGDLRWRPRFNGERPKSQAPDQQADAVEGRYRPCSRVSHFLPLRSSA